MTEATVTTESVDELRAGTLGPVLVPGDEGYDEGRAAWNGFYDRRPAVIVQCMGVADIQAALVFARANGLVVAVRGGGHSSSGASTIEGGMLIDLGLMAGVRVDPEARTAIAAGGSLLAQLDRETAVHSLGVTAGTVSHTGIGGLTLGGGVGRLMRKYGLTCDSVLSFDIVTADGELRHVDKDNHPDLFWALRGGGGTFGIVTHFEYQLHPLNPIVYGGYLGWPVAQAKEVYDAIHPLVESAPDDLQVQYIFTTGPIDDFIPPSLQGQPCLMMTLTWVGEDLAEGEKYLAPFREKVPPTLDMLGQFPYVMLQAASDALAPHGRWNVASTPGYLDAVTPEVFDIAMEYVATFPTPWTFIEFSLMGGQVARVPKEENAATLFRDAAYFYIVGGNTITTEEVEPLQAWTDSSDAAFQAHARPGRYVNFLAGDDEDGMREAIGAETYARLMEIKAKYDPDGVFAHNPNKRSTPVAQTA